MAPRRFTATTQDGGRGRVAIPVSFDPDEAWGAKGMGVDPQQFLDAVGGGPLDLPYVQNKAAAILAADWTPNFSVTNAAKDADLIQAAAETAGLRLDMAAGAAARLHRAADQGHGDADMAANYLASFG